MKMRSATGRTLRNVGLGLACVAMLQAAIGAYGVGQSPALAESTKALYTGSYVQAAQVAKKHLRSHPSDAAVRVILARADLAQGKFEAAFEELRKALTSDPHNIDAFYYMALVARELSWEQYQKLVSLAPDSARAHQLLAEADLAAQNPTEAEAEFKNALRVNPSSGEVATELAELKRSQSKFDEAISYYTQAADHGTLNYEIAYGLGACYTYKQDYAQAVMWLRKAVTLDPDSSAGRFALGNALFQGGQLEAAIPELKRSLELEPRLKQAYFLLGRIYARLGRMDEAHAALRKLDELSRSEVPGQDQGSAGAIPVNPDQH
jgi:tetratricopeptide (TPR) repeat protein